MKKSRPPRPELSPTERILFSENRRLKRKLAHREGVDKIITARMSELFSDMEMMVNLPPPVQRPKARGGAVVGLVHITDTQIGKVTKTYDSNIAYWRLMELAESTTRYLLVHNALAGIRELHVYLGGDIVEGELIFPHQAHLIDSCVLDQALRHAPSMLASVIVHWLEHFDLVKIFAVSGNHGRPGSKHDGSHPKTNWDRACYVFTEELIRRIMLERKIPANKLAFTIADSFYLLDEIVPGVVNMLTHGDLIRGGSTGGIPLAATVRMVRGWADTIPRNWHNLFYGHYHQVFSFEVGSRRVFCGGTTESDNQYALAELASQSRPQQVVSIWKPGYGQIDELRVQLRYGLDDGPRKADQFRLREPANG